MPERTLPPVILRGMMESAPVAIRNVAVAIPLRDEAETIAACLDAIDRAAARYRGHVTVVAFANGCTDDSVAILAGYRPRHFRLDARAASMLPGAAHAGWARRLALDAAADRLTDDRDLLLGTDADTLVAPDWIVRTVAHIDGGHDAVAGLALTLRAERAALGPAAAARLNLLGRYFTAVDYLRAPAAAHDPWPCHGYEGGASMALTRGLYRRIGGAPTPPVGEDRALFAAVRAAGGRIRHARDVRVFTSCRTHGRAPGGMADTLRTWISQDAQMPLHETYPVHVMIAPQDHDDRRPLTFATLPTAVATARRIVRARRHAADAASTGVPLRPAPQVEPVGVVALGMDG
ncbi:glycosyltransferase [Sphingomonas montana]|uniref:glycosyltransferase n=1 Tax=Sphingomonas montana TaxID=1843236 RepID=UPI00096D51FB|nr:glycosyltransferase family 2 protein [Sphingomonas montana]